MKDSQIRELIKFGSLEGIDALVVKHEDIVARMAEDLSGSTKHIAKICEQVFVEVSQAIADGSTEDTAELIHRFTYQLAIASLLSDLVDENQEAEQAFRGIVAAEGASDELMAADYVEEVEEELTDWDLTDTHVLFEELSASGVQEIH